MWDGNAHVLPSPERSNQLSAAPLHLLCAGWVLAKGNASS